MRYTLGMPTNELLAAIADDASPAIADLATRYPALAANDIYNLVEESDVEPHRAARLRSYADALLALSEEAAA